jgi:RNA polymerase sigma factor (sigma-70 family)
MATDQFSGVLRHVRTAALGQDGGGQTDGQLLECFLTRRDEAAFEALLQRHGPMVLGVCRRVLRHRQDAEDAFQATFLIFARKATTIRKRESLASWLHRTAFRSALEANAARRRSRERQVGAMPEPEAAVVEDVWSDLRAKLDQELDRLPDKYREAVVLCDLEGKTRKEAARQLGVPEGTLSGRLTTARRMLTGRLARHGRTISSGVLAGILSERAASAGVPKPLLLATVRAVATVTAGRAAVAGVVSVHVAAITEGVLKTMFLTKLKVATALLIAILAGVGTLALLPMAAGQTEPAKKADANPRQDPRPEMQGRFLGRLVLFGAQRQDADQPTIVAMNPDGSKIETVFTAPRGSAFLAGRIAPGGKRLAFSLQEPGKESAEVWLLDGTGHARKVADGALVQAWSPDGKKLLCIRGKDRTWESFVVDLDNLKERRLDLPKSDWAEDWSPDGKWLSVTHYPEKHFNHPRIAGPYPLRQSYLLAFDGKKGPRLSTDAMHDDLRPRFSPSGRHVAYTQRRHEDGIIFYSLMIVQSDGQRANELVSLYKLAKDRGYDDMRDNSPPCWSADGKTVASLALGSKGLGTPQVQLTPELIFSSPERGFLRSICLHDLGIQLAGKVDWR